MKKTVLLILVSIISFAFFQENSIAETYYVYGSGGSDSNDGSAMNPSNGWRTIQKALDTINRGDICYVREGVYTEAGTSYLIANRNPSGAAGHATIASWPSNTSDVIIAHGRTTTSVLIEITGDHWKFLGHDNSYLHFDASDQNDSAIVATWQSSGYSDDIWLEYCKFTAGGPQKDPRNSSGIVLSENSTKNWTIKNCEIAYVRQYGILLPGSSWDSYHTLDSNKIHHTGRHAISLNQGENIIINNQLYHSGHAYDLLNCGGGGISMDTNNGNVIAWNEIYDNSIYGIATWQNSTGHIITGNILYDNGSFDNRNCSGQQKGGIIVAGGSDPNNPTIVANNTIYSDDMNGINVRATSIYIAYGSGHAKVYNNIVALPQDGYCLWVEATARNYTVEDNIFYSTSGPVINDEVLRRSFDCTNVSNYGTNNICQDPQFVDPGWEGNRTPWGLKLQPSSPAIDSGRDLGPSGTGEIPEPYDRDFSGNIWTGFWEIGAYSFGGNNPPPQPPNGLIIIK